jgi:hypothetical protein
MRKHRAIVGTALLVLALGTPTSQLAEEASNGTEKTTQQNGAHPLAIGFLRTINVAEVTERSKYSSYSSWKTLLVHESEYLNGWFAAYYSHEPNVHFDDPPEIMSGWSLRFEVHADGQGYDVRLQDLNDKRCGYAAITDESGVIRQSKALDCEIE